MNKMSDARGIPSSRAFESSEIFLDTLGSSGSVNTACLTYTQIRIYTGADMLLYNDTRLGTTIKIATSGVYSMYMSHYGNPATFGVLLNPELYVGGAVTTVEAVGANILAYQRATSNLPSSTSITLPLKAGDIIRAGSTTAPAGGDGYQTVFKIAKVK